MMNEKERHERIGAEGIGGWLLVLCVLLIAWGPIQLSLVASSALSALAVRGAPLAIVIVVRMVVAAFGLAAGLTLLARRPAGVTMARASLVLTAATDAFVSLTPFFPSNRLPGDEVIYVGVSALYATGWLAYLARSRRVRATFD